MTDLSYLSDLLGGSGFDMVKNLSFAYMAKERLPIFQQLKSKLEGTDSYCIVYVNQDPNSAEMNKEMVMTINSLTQFPIVMPYDVFKSDLNGIVILDKKSADKQRSKNVITRHAAEVIGLIISWQQKLIDKVIADYGHDIFDGMCRDMETKNVLDKTKTF